MLRFLLILMTLMMLMSPEESTVYATAHWQEDSRVLGVIGCMQQCQSMCYCSQFWFYHNTSTCRIDLGNPKAAKNRKNCECAKDNDRCLSTRIHGNTCKPMGLR